MKRAELLKRLIEHGRVDPEPLYTVVISDLHEPKVFDDRDVAIKCAQEMAKQRDLVQVPPSKAAREKGVMAQWFPHRPTRWPRIWIYETLVNFDWKGYSTMEEKAQDAPEQEELSS